MADNQDRSDEVGTHTRNVPLFLGALSGLLAVGFGAFGAHALKGHLTTASLEVFRTGVQYHLVHAVAIVAVAALPLSKGRVNAVCTLFAVGTVLFSGSLYALALTNVKAFGAIAPLGGLSFLAGWSLLAWGAFFPSSVHLD